MQKTSSENNMNTPPSFSEQDVWLHTKDHAFSKQDFSLLFNEEYQLLKTHPFPSLAELPRYYSDNYLSHTNAKNSLFEKAYQFVKRIMMQRKMRLIHRYQPNKGKILDIGTGTGDFLATASLHHWTTVGVEPNQNARSIAMSKGITLVDSADHLGDHTFDMITMWHVLEHLPDIHHEISTLKRLLKPSGHIVIAVPNHLSFDAKYYKSYWDGYDVPRHLWHFSKKAIKKLFEAHDLNVVKVELLWFDSFYVSLLSEKHKTGKMNPLRAFFIGLISNIIGYFKKETTSLIYIIEHKKS